ncbi:MAG: cation:proton antiporter [Lachnospiraceae bacterium]|nr:cation:proton antiporter [Lachnospiraceae bacterium]
MNIYISLAIALAFALASSKLMKFLKLPNVTGYLIAGLIAGPYVLGIIDAGTVESLGIIPEVALGFIAFSIGAEFRLSYLKKVGSAPLIIAITESLGAVLVVDLALIIAGFDVPFSLSLGAIAAATAPAATLMVVKQYKAKGEVTDTLIAVVALDDAAALMCFGISVAIAKSISGSEGFTASAILGPFIEIFGALLLGAVAGICFRFLTMLFTGRGNRLAIAFALVFTCVGVGKLLGLSALLACMVMGAVFCNTSKNSDAVFELTDRMTPPLYMLFFFVSGAQLDISILPSIGLIGVIYIVARVIGKIGGAMFGSVITHSSKNIRNHLGFMLVPQAGVAIGLAATAMTVVPEHGPTIRTVILCGTVIYELTGPLITKIALKRSGEIAQEK